MTGAVAIIRTLSPWTDQPSCRVGAPKYVVDRGTPFDLPSCVQLCARSDGEVEARL